MNDRRTDIPSRLNLVIFLLQLLALAGCFILAARLRSGWAVGLLAAGFGLLMNSVYSIIHEAEHGILFRSRRTNDLAGAFMALFFPAPFHLLRQGHLGHHQRNRSDDEAFDFYFNQSHRLWRGMVFYGIITGFYWVVVVLSNVVFLFVPSLARAERWEFDRPSQAFMQSLNPG